MNNLIEHINVVDGFNINPISLEAGQEMTTTKWLMAMQSKINNFIDQSNGVLGTANAYTDEQISALNNSLNQLLKSIEDGSYLLDGSIDISKINSTFMATIEETVTTLVNDRVKLVWFGLDDDGHFCAWIPSNWSNIKFTTDMEGHLILNY